MLCPLSYTKSGLLFFLFPEYPIFQSSFTLFLCLLLLCFVFFCSKYQDLESEKVLAESADIYVILDCIVWLQRPYVRQQLCHGSLYTAGQSLPLFFLSLALIYTHKSVMSHHHRTITQARTHTLTKRKKNLFSTHTYTNTHLHSAAVCAQIQCLRAK